MKWHLTVRNLVCFSQVIFLFSQCGETPEPKQLTSEQLYFMEVSFESEFSGGYENLRKWNSNVKIFVPETGYPELMDELNSIISEINSESNTIQLELVATQAESNYIIYFGDANTYATTYEPNAANYINNNWGLFWIYWNSNYEIYKGSMYVDVIRTTSVNCQKHLLREELTQSLGLMNDSVTYPTSIFYQNWSCSPSYADIDKQLISWQLSIELKTGMTRTEVTNWFLTSL